MGMVAVHLLFDLTVGKAKHHVPTKERWGKPVKCVNKFHWVLNTLISFRH